jgi:hypothetical protein
VSSGSRPPTARWMSQVIAAAHAVLVDDDRGVHLHRFYWRFGVPVLRSRGIGRDHDAPPLSPAQCYLLAGWRLRMVGTSGSSW